MIFSATHPMDCADIVVGASVGGVGQVRDYYTLSRATPQLDEYYGGRKSLTSATAFEQDGMTTVVFRKKLSSRYSSTIYLMIYFYIQMLVMKQLIIVSVDVINQ